MPSTFSTSSPNYIAVGDLNGDGELDFYTPGQLYLSNGHRSYSAPATVAPTFLNATIGDVNGDHHPDLVGAMYFPGGYTIATLLNRGDGTFADAVMATTTLQPTDPEVGGLMLSDVDHDGRLDVIALSQPSGVLVYRGNGDGTFGSPSVTSTAGTAVSTAFGDFNHDGNVDIAIGTANGLEILAGDGHGSFSVSTLPLTLSHPAIAAADFDHDGRIDIVLADQNAGTLELYRGAGDGTFPFAPIESSLPAEPNAVAVASLNSDAAPDLVFTTVAGSLLTLLNDGTGRFTADRRYAPGRSVLAAADFDHDGHVDILAGAPYAVSILYGTAGGAFSAPAAMPDRGYLALGRDLDGDGIPEIVSIGDSGLNVYKIDNTGSWHRVATSFMPSIVGIHDLTVADFNGDGRPDVGVLALNTAYVFIQRPDGTFDDRRWTNVPGAAHMASADFNRDGAADLALSGSNGVTILLSNHDGTFTASTQQGIGGSDVVAAADLDGDSLPDLVAGSSVYRGRGDGTFEASPIKVGADGSAIKVVPFDMDGDGVLELVYLYNFELDVYRQSGGTFAKAAHLALPRSYDVSAADVDLDGLPDLIVASLDSVSVYTPAGSTFYQALTYPTPQLAQTADTFVSKGVRRFVFASYSAGQVWVATSDGACPSDGSDHVAPLLTISTPYFYDYATASPITVALDATDQVGVVAYFSSTSPSIPAASASGWVPVTPSKVVSTQFAVPLANDGLVTLYVWVKDGAGNVSATQSRTFTFDHTPPTNGTLTVASSAPGVLTLAWTGQTDATSGLQLTAPFKLVGVTGSTPPADCSGPGLYFGPSGDVSVHDGQPYSYRLCATDRAGNTNTGATTTGTAHPTVTITSPSTPGYTTPFLHTTIAGTARSSDLITNVSLKNTTTGATQSLPTNDWEPHWSFDVPVVPGANQIVVTITNSLNVQASATITINVSGGDFTAPAGTIAIESGPFTRATQVTIDLAGTDDGGITAYILDTSSLSPALTDGRWLTAGPTTAFTVVRFMTIPATDGPTTFYYWLRDANGNISRAMSATVIYDVTPPLNGRLNAVSAAGSVSLSWNGQVDAASGVASYKLVVAQGSTTPANCSGAALASTSPFIHSGLVAGQTYSYRLCATDFAGNTSSGATATVTVSSAPPPPPPPARRRSSRP